MHLYKTYARPILENNSPVFSPHSIQDINFIEFVQKRFTKYLPEIFYLDYSDRLTSLNLESLKKKRIKFDLVLTFKNCKDLTHLNFSDFFKYSSSATRRHILKLEKKLL